MESLAAKPDVPRVIRAADYKLLDMPETNVAYYVCGMKGAWFIEKLTAERRAWPWDQWEPRRTCRPCYQEALRVEQLAKQPLPGTIDVSSCTRLTADVGRCSVCSLEKAVWAGPVTTGVKLCEHCYEREVRGRSLSN